MLVVDGLSDRFPTVTDREADWGDTPYAFGSIWNFGGHTTLGANTPDWATLFKQWRTKQGSTLRGVALLPEAADNNPAVFDLFSELAWEDDDLDLKVWFEEWAHARYGARDPHAEAAWDILRRTAYGTTRADSWSEGADAAERKELAYDNLSLLTVLGTRQGADAGLHDYANQEWASLVGGLYRLRWSTYFDELRAALAEGRQPKTVDWFALEDRWTRNPGKLATRPTGDTYEAAARVRDRLTAPS